MITREKCCCFTGHRNIPVEMSDWLKGRIQDGIEYLYQNHGVTTFYSGGALGFDTLAAEAVIVCRQKHEDIRLVIVTPCLDQSKFWREENRRKYRQILEVADETVHTSANYCHGCMFKRNRYLADHSRYCICYLSKQTGGTAYTVSYARQKGVRVFNLAYR